MIVYVLEEVYDQTGYSEVMGVYSSLALAEENAKRCKRRPSIFSMTLDDPLPSRIDINYYPADLAAGQPPQP